MAFSLNRAQIIGNITRDPEVRMAGSQKVATFSIATNLTWKDQSGQKKEKAEFHNIVAWRRLAEICEQYVRKGSKIYVEGRIQTRDWQGEDGVKRYRTEIVMENMIMLDKKGAPIAGGQSISNEDSSPSPASDMEEMPREQRSVKAKAPASAPQEEEVSIDDLPF